MRNLLFILLFGCVGLCKAQDKPSLSFAQYITYVRENHPIIKQANNKAASGTANLQMARGAFDPKLEFENNQKTFEGSEYYNESNGSVTIPTWYGISLKGSYSLNDGIYLNPVDKTPQDGLYSAGIEINASEGLWINKRMATLKQASFIVTQTKAEQALMINEVITQAALAYFKWLMAYENYKVNDQYVNNANLRFSGIKERALQGDLATIDTLESFTNVQQRILSLSQSNIDLVKARLEASNFLWGTNNVPLEIAKNATPLDIDELSINKILGVNDGVLDRFFMGVHPKITMLNAKLDGLKVDRSLKRAALFPDMTLNYNFLQTNPEFFIPLDQNQFKAGVKVAFPLFLRKERGALKLTNLKVSDTQWDLNYERVKIQNKVTQTLQAQDALLDQYSLMNKMVLNYNTLLQGEQQKFNMGESSLFVVISREQKLIEAKIKKNTVQNKYFETKLNLFNALVLKLNL